MPKKSNRRTSRRQASPTKLPPEAIGRKAREDLAGGRYREAIAELKQLLKLDPSPTWRSALADAYAGRARELAAKNMLKEALAIWENRAALGEDIGFDPEHAALLVRMGRLNALLDLYLHADAIPPSDRDRLRALLAAAYLGGEGALAERLPADDPVALHGAPARAALSAYCGGDWVALQEALAQIPFRSPYRDWVQILKALQRLPEEPREAVALLDRVSDQSAFGNLRRAAQLALLPEKDFLEAIRDQRQGSARFACVLRGWPQARIALWEELDRLGADDRPEVLLRFLYRHRDALGADWVRRRALRLVIAGFGAGRKWLAAAGGGSLSTRESLLLAAWDAERREDLWGERQSWDDFARHLIRSGPGDGGEVRHRLRVALALRRCDRHADVLAHASSFGDEEDLDSLVTGQLEESLTWDPDDRDTYLRLIGYYRRGKRRADVRRLLEQARDRWPRDMQLLDAALDIALETGAFKKAAGLAREILALDSINSGVRERLVEAHLAHARKQVVKGRRDLARKELAAAADWARSSHARDQLDLTAALIALIEEPARGAVALRDLVRRLGGGLAAHLTLALAGEAVGIAPQELFEGVGIDMPAVAGRDDLLATLARLRRQLDGGGKITGELGTHLSKALATAPWTDLPKNETEAACETLRRCGLHKIRLGAARTALKRWQGEPLFELHAFEAKYPGRFGNCSDRDIDRLDAAISRARTEGDVRTAMRIEKILDALDPFTFGPMPFAPPPPSGRGSSLLDAASIAMVIEMLGLDKTLNSLGLPPDMKRDIKQLAREQGKEAVARALAQFLEMIGGIASGEIAPPLPGPPTRRPPEPKPGRPKRRPGDDGAQDDDFLDQLDLFR